MFEAKKCVSCDTVAKAGPIPYGWDIAPIYLREGQGKTLIKTLFKCLDCVTKTGCITNSYIDELEKEIAKEARKKPKKRRRK